MRHSKFINGLAGTGAALIATALYAGLASAAPPPPLQPAQTNPVVSTTTNDKVIAIDNASSTTVVSKSDTTVIAPGSSDNSSGGTAGSSGTSAPILAVGGSGTDNVIAGSVVSPATAANLKTGDGVSTTGLATGLAGSSPAVTTALVPSVSVQTPAAPVAKRFAAAPVRAVAQAFSEAGSGLSVVIAVPVVLAGAPAPEQAPVKSTGILTQLGELLRHLFAPLVAAVSGLAIAQSGSSWPLVNLYSLLVASLFGMGFASYLSLLRRSGYQHGARSDEDDRHPVTPLLTGFSAVAYCDILGGPFLVGLAQAQIQFNVRNAY